MTPTAHTRPPFTLRLRPRRSLTDQEELVFYRAAHRARPEECKLRLGLIRYLNALSRFEEAAEFLATWNVNELPFLELSIKTQIALGTTASVEKARVLCADALSVCPSDGDRAGIHNLLADVLFRLGRVEDARAAALSSLELGGYQHEPYAFLLRIEIARGHAERLLTYAGGWLEKGPPASGIISSIILAQAHLGRPRVALETRGLDRFLRQYEPAPPSGWDTLEAFNRALAHELMHHPSSRGKVEGASSLKTRHVPQPDLQRSHVYHAFQSLIQHEVAAYAATLPELDDHPFLRMRQGSGTLANWCVLTEGEGHERWHQHPGWLSGTYYVQVPDHIANGTGKAGCIAFGLPDDGPAAPGTNGFDEVLVRPRPGLLVLFPSYAHHKTYPHCGPGVRICCAFDIELETESGSRTEI